MVKSYWLGGCEDPAPLLLITSAARKGGEGRGEEERERDAQSHRHKWPLTTLVEPAFFDDRHLVHGGSVTRCHLAQDSSGQQDMQEQSTICKTREELIRVGGRLGPSPFPGDLQALWPLWMLFFCTWWSQ